MADKIVIKRAEAKAEAEKKFEFNIVQELYKCNPRSNGKQVRVDYAAWNDGEPAYEIRIWAKDKSGQIKATKGLGLTASEMIELKEFFAGIEVE